MAAAGGGIHDAVGESHDERRRDVGIGVVIDRFDVRWERLSVVIGGVIAVGGLYHLDADDFAVVVSAIRRFVGRFLADNARQTHIPVDVAPVDCDVAVGVVVDAVGAVGESRIEVKIADEYGTFGGNEAAETRRTGEKRLVGRSLDAAVESGEVVIVDFHRIDVAEAGDVVAAQHLASEERLCSGSQFGIEREIVSCALILLSRAEDAGGEKHRLGVAVVGSIGEISQRLFHFVIVLKQLQAPIVLGGGETAVCRSFEPTIGEFLVGFHSHTFYIASPQVVGVDVGVVLRGTDFQEFVRLLFPSFVAIFKGGKTEVFESLDVSVQIGIVEHIEGDGSV